MFTGKNGLLVGLGALVFLALHFTFHFLFQTQGVLLTDSWVRVSGDEEVAVDLPEQFLVPNPTIVVYRTAFERDATLLDGELPDVLVLPSISGYGMRVLLNGQMLYQLGDEQEKTANIWSHFHVVHFLPSSLQPQNEIEIQLFALFDAGITGTPYLDRWKNVRDKVVLANVVEDHFFLMAVGMAIIFGLVLLFTAVGVPENRKANVLFGTGMVLVAYYLLDYQFRLYSGSEAAFLLFRKSLFSAMFFSVFLLVSGNEIFATGKMKISRFFSVGLVVVQFFVWTAPSFYVLKLRYNFLLLFLLACIGLFFYLVVSRRQVAFLVSSAFMFLCLVHDLSIVWLDQLQVFYVSYAIVSFVVSIGFVMVYYLRSTHKKLQLAHRKSLMDPLTGAFNRAVLPDICFEKGDSFVLVDLDHFKEMNDRYGHKFGDQVLQDFVRFCRQQMRESDFLVRMGGDEFLLLLKACPKSVSLQRMETVSAVFSKHHSNPFASFSYGICDAGGDFQDCFERADQLLYEMKKGKKEKATDW